MTVRELMQTLLAYDLDAEVELLGADGAVFLVAEEVVLECE